MESSTTREPHGGQVQVRSNVSFAGGREALGSQVRTPENQAGLPDVDFHRGGNSGLLQTECAINKLEETHRSELQKRTDAIVRAGAKRGVLIDYDSTYQAELAKMSAELREAKRMARLEGAALEKIGLPLEEDWRSQFAPDRVARFTIAASKETSWLPRPTAKHVSQWRACRSFTGAAANRSNQGPIPRLRANDPLPHRAGACNQNRPSLNQWEKYEKEPNRHRWHKLCANLCSACRGHRGKNSLA